MRLERALEILAPLALCVGLIGLIAEALPLLGAISSLSTTTAGACALVLVGATAGLMNAVVIRRQCRTIASVTRESARQGVIAYIPKPDNSLGHLVAAVNDAIAVAQSVRDDSLMHAKELEIQLKVVSGEQQQTQAILHSINDAVIVTDQYDELMMANQAAATTLGFKLENSQRTPLDKLVTDPALGQIIRDMRQSKSINERRTVEHRTKNGKSEKIYQVRLSCISNRAGEVVGVVTVLHDMTRENEIARMKNDFVSSVSHELRTPLSSIRAYVEMLVDGEAQDEKTRGEFYEIIQNEANRLGRLIDNILSISRIESGLVEIKKEPVSPVILIKQALEVMVPQARLKDIRIEEQLGPAIHQVNADRDMIYQSALNLLSNAVKYTPNGGTVTIRTAVDEVNKKIVVRVIDTGVGIPAKDLPFVFGKFFRVEANKNVAKGTGLGLSLVKNMIETVHRGRVFVESEQGKGSTFGFELNLC